MDARRAGGRLRRLPRHTRGVRCGGRGRRSPDGDGRGDGAVVPGRRERYRQRGAAADPSQPLVEVADPAALDIVFNVSPAEAARIRAGDAVELSPGEGSGAALGRGVVTSVAATVDAASRAVAVRASARPARPLRI